MERKRRKSLEGQISPIHNSDNYRGIGVIKCLLKVLCTMVNNRLNKYCGKNKSNKYCTNWIKKSRTSDH